MELSAAGVGCIMFHVCLSGLVNGPDYLVTVGTPNSKIETPNVKKRHRRAKSGTNKVDANQDAGRQPA